MTDENVRRNVQDESRVADSALAAAQALVDLGLAPDAASRAYYAALNAARAGAGVRPMGVTEQTDELRDGPRSPGGSRLDSPAGPFHGQAAVPQASKV